MCSVYAGKTSTPRARIHGRRDAGPTQPVAAPRHRNVPSSDETPLSPQAGPTSPISLQRTNSSQSSASVTSSVSGGGSSTRSGPVPKPRPTAAIRTGTDEVDLAPVRRPDREPRRRPAPSRQEHKPGERSQSSPGDRLKVGHHAPPAPTAKATTPSRNGVVAGHSGTPKTHQQVDRSLGSLDAPLTAFVDRSGLVFDVRSKAAYRRGRLLGKVLSSFITNPPT